MVEAIRHPPSDQEHDGRDNQVCDSKDRKAMPQESFELGVSSGSAVNRHVSSRGIRKPQGRNQSEYAANRHTERVDSKRFRAQHTSQVDFEEISRARGKQSSSKEDRGMPRDLSHLAAKSRFMAGCEGCLRRLEGCIRDVQNIPVCAC